VRDQQLLYNSYTDTIRIIFKDPIINKKINIECRTYDLYGYGGFFSCGWLYTV